MTASRDRAVRGGVPPAAGLPGALRESAVSAPGSRSRVRYVSGWRLAAEIPSSQHSTQVVWS